MQLLRNLSLEELILAREEALRDFERAEQEDDRRRAVEARVKVQNIQAQITNLTRKP